MRKSFKKALSLVLALAMIMSMACITNITASAETNQYMLGDVNMDGLVNVNDATTIQRFAASLITLSDNQRYLADVNGDGLVNVNDATYVQRYAANLLSSYEENPDGIKIGEIVDFGEDPTLPTPPATTETATETVAPTTQPETNPSVDYSKYSLVGYINGADAGSGDDYENAPYVFSADGTQTLTVTETSYVFVKTTNNSSWYMFEELCQGTSGILKNTADGTSEKMMVPAGEVTFTLVEYVDGTLGLSYVVGGETEPATTAPATEEPTEAPTQAPTEAPTTPVGSINVSVDNQTTWLYKDGAALFFYDNATGEHYAVDANGVATIPEEATNLTLYRCKESWGNGSKTDEVTSYWNKFGPLTRAADETILTIKGSSDYYWTKGETPTQAVTTAPVTEPDTTAPATEPDTTAPVELSNYRLLGTLTSWNPDEVEAMPYIEDGVAGMTLELAAGTYNFKLKGTSNWYGNNGTIIDTTVTTSTGGWVMSTSEDDCTLEATGGTYTFKFDVNTKKLIVLWDGYQADTTAPVTEPETTVPETTEEVTEAPTETQGEAITLYYLPKAEDVAAGYFFRANVKVTTDGTSDWRQYPLTALEGTPYYTATITPDYDSIDTIQYQVYSDAEFETWVSQIRFDGVTSIKTYADKVADAATGTLKELGEEETTAPATEPETTAPVEETTAPAVDYSKYSLVGYINGADAGSGDDYENAPYVFSAEGTQTLTFTQTSYVFVKTTDNSAWYMFKEFCQDTTGTLKNTADGTSEKMMVPAGEVTFTLVENADGTLTLSYVAKEAPTDEPTEPETTAPATEPETTVPATEPETTAPATEPETTVPETTEEVTEAPTETQGEAITLYYLPKAEDVAAGYFFRANVKVTTDGTSDWRQYPLTALEGTPYYTATITPDYDSIDLIQYQVYSDAEFETWVSQIRFDGVTSIKTYADKVADAATGTLKELGEEETTAPATEPETTAPAVDYSKYSLVGYINGADAGSGDDYENAPYIFSAEGTQTLTFTQTSYVFVKTTDNSAWYMFEEFCQDTTGTLKNTADGTSEKMMVPAGEVTFTLVENADGTLTLSYVAKEAPTDEPTEPETTAPATEPETTVPATEPETTVPATEPETTAPATEPETTAPATEPETTAPVTEPETTAPVELSNYRLLGTLTSWNPDEVEAMPYVEDGVAGMTLELAAGTYNFKLKGTSNWYGNNGTIIDTTVTTSTGGWIMSTSEDDCTLEATGGTYTFKFNVSTKALVVLWDGSQADTTAPATEPETTEPATTAPATEPATTEPSTEPDPTIPAETIKVKVVDNAGWLSNDGAALFLYDNATGEHYALDGTGSATIPVDATDLTLYRCKGRWNSGSESNNDEGITTYWNKFTPAARTEGQNVLTVNSSSDFSWAKEEASSGPEVGEQSSFKVAGSFNNWGSSTDYLCYTETENVVSVTLELEEGQHTFKITDGTNWYGNNGTFTDSAEKWTMSTNQGNCTLNATGGTYTFTFDISTSKLTVTKA